MKSDMLIQSLGDIQGNALYIKREDLLPISFGGNKARKAQHFFEEIGAGDYDTVVTYGSSSSNHCRVVANMAAARGMQCCIISPEEASHPTFNSAMMKLFNAKVTVCPVKDVHDTIEDTLAQLRAAGKTPYFIAGGGHGNHGTRAYVDCYDEILRYEQNSGVDFDYIFHASGTGTTQAGLTCGKLLRGGSHNIVGISIARRKPHGREVVLASVHEYLNELQVTLDEREIEDAVVFEDEWAGGYAQENPEILRVIRDALIQFCIPMDSTYVGKAFWGMKEFIKREAIEGKRILFIHTGGTPLFFDDLKKGL